MSVLIKGMEMPTSCDECRLMSLTDTNCVPELYCGCNIVFQAWPQGVGYRPDFCPLVPVPPHGRLIDEQWLKDAMIATLEALKKNPKMDKQEMHLIAAFDTLRVMVEDAPTVIEAEGGET